MDNIAIITILESVERVDGLISRGGLMKLLHGQTTRGILRNGLDHIDQFGVLASMSKEGILDHVDNLIELGCLQISGLMFPMIQITDVGRNRLKTTLKYMLRWSQWKLHRLNLITFMCAMRLISGSCL